MKIEEDVKLDFNDVLPTLASPRITHFICSIEF